MKKTRALRSKRAFTLVEVLVAVAVIAVLSTIVGLSVAAVQRSSEKKGATTTIKSAWKITNDYFYQLNAGFGSSTGPTEDQLKTRVGDKLQILSTYDPTSVDAGRIYIQYSVNKGNLSGKYSIVKIVYNYKGNYYYSTDGDTVYGPSESL